MAYVDPSDSILKWENGDLVTPLPTKMNMHLDSVGLVTNKLNREGVYRVNTIPERTALVNRVGSTNINNANPLIVWRANATAGQQLEYTTNGSNWYYVQSSQYTEPVYAINSVVAANVSIPHATFTKVANWAIVERSGFSFVTGGGLYDIPVNGWYNVTAQFAWNTPGNDNRYTLIRFSGNSSYRSKMMDFGSVTTTLRYLLAGSTVQFDVYQTTGGAIQLEGNPERSVISIVKVA